jgi:ABC-type polysaccharide/polyol phosphate transport system ATPase subunit
MAEKREISIKVQDLVISYKDVNRVSFKNLFNHLPQTSNTFTAVKGVSFEVTQGEIIGICGKNGSGKSTLLNAIGGIFSADSGSVDLFGNSISLLSIGVGFQKSLSGRDNIFLSGLLLGYTKEQIAARYDEIVAFSELGDFIEKPVSSYSSGMYSKLAFSITAILETDIMLIDEVFSVGDERFKKKSYAKMSELISHENRTVIIVSHTMKTLVKLCNRVLWLHEGKMVEIGDPKTVVGKYSAFMDKEI